jgi:micrococcal nuclease
MTYGESDIEILSVTSPVEPDGYATVSIRGKPGVKYNISVIYYSGPSKASGLKSKTADDDGLVSWTWHVGPSTREGEWEIKISGGGDKAKTHFTVKD